MVGCGYHIVQIVLALLGYGRRVVVIERVRTVRKYEVGNALSSRIADFNLFVLDVAKRCYKAI